MVLTFKTDFRGFGLPMTDNELAKVKFVIVVLQLPNSSLEQSPVVYFLEYGMKKDGYWPYDMLAQQVTDFPKCFQVLSKGV